MFLETDTVINENDCQFLNDTVSPISPTLLQCAIFCEKKKKPYILYDENEQPYSNVHTE